MRKELTSAAMFLPMAFIIFLTGACAEKAKDTKFSPTDTNEADSRPTDVPVSYNWFTLDPEQNNEEGVSADRLYRERPLPANAEDVIVAVIDSGVDVHHEDLRNRIWVNEAEANGTEGVDDDNNGYVDDIYGWNFLGGPRDPATGEWTHVNAETLEMTRIKKRLSDRVAEGETLSEEEQELLQTVTTAVDEERAYSQRRIDQARTALDTLQENYNSISDLVDFPFEEMTRVKVLGVPETEERAVIAKRNILEVFEATGRDNVFILNRIVEVFQQRLDTYFNMDFDPRSEIVGDDPSDFTDTQYGNPDVIGPDADHGTHVAGIIAAERNNHIGIRGIAEKVKIMALRAVPNGDERDKDVALAIRYAVDNGARIINMSFGKGFSPYQAQVDEALRHAADNGVLLIHAAGNDSKNNDFTPSYPNRAYTDGSGDVSTWIEVGASAAHNNNALVAWFSNYGKKTVDIFAPGRHLESTIPGNQYAIYSGTSMAAPSASGVAALIMNFNPEMTGPEVRQLMFNTGRTYNRTVIQPVERGSGLPLVPFSSLSITGKITSVYNAVMSILSL